MTKSILAAVAVMMLAAPALAQTAPAPAPTTKADCEKQADKKWDDKTKTCVKK